MKRRLLNFAAILSLLLAVVTIVFWFRSTTRRDVAEIPYWPHSYDEFVLQSQEGMLQFENYPNNAGLSGFSIDYSKVRKNRWLIWQTEFDLNTVGDSVTDNPAHVWVPHWFVVLIFLVLPMYCFAIAWLNRNRFETGMCQHCGYDLRATPERCPECGMSVSDPTKGA